MLAKIAGRSLVRLTVIVGAVIALTPMVWVLLASFSTNEKVGSSATGFLGGFHVSNYVNAFTESQFGSFFLNSVAISVCGAVILAVLAACAAYSLANISYRGKAIVFALVMVGLIIPVYGYFIQLSNTAQTLHIFDTRTAVVLAEVAAYLPVPILIMLSFYRQVPREMTESARVDGAHEATLFLRIILPLARPAIVLCLVFGFVWIWGDLFLTEVLLVSPSKYTIPAGISLLTATQQTVPTYVTLFAAAIMSTIPMIAVYGYMSRHVGDLITGGAVRG
jgi:ABC-type glycerol-3-phosphate transport system permease component